MPCAFLPDRTAAEPVPRLGGPDKRRGPAGRTAPPPLEALDTAPYATTSDASQKPGRGEASQRKRVVRLEGPANRPIDGSEHLPHLGKGLPLFLLPQNPPDHFEIPLRPRSTPERGELSLAARPGRWGRLEFFPSRRKTQEPLSVHHEKIYWIWFLIM
ncbi:hypothetical protein Shyhy02_73330 [Streptomyces hygroscopicus subsp. hygroscopicus]|nr:hypothetical protein Shyhy02_73330 [Streptomyces hygroscopicus subsp. hygroscopicus]